MHLAGAQKDLSNLLSTCLMLKKIEFSKFLGLL